MVFISYRTIRFIECKGIGALAIKQDIIVGVENAIIFTHDQNAIFYQINGPVCAIRLGQHFTAIAKNADFPRVCLRGVYPHIRQKFKTYTVNTITGYGYFVPIACSKYGMPYLFLGHSLTGKQHIYG